MLLFGKKDLIYEGIETTAFNFISGFQKNSKLGQ